MGQTNFCFGFLPFSPWAILAKQLHIGAPQKNTRNTNLQSISNKNYHGLVWSWNSTCLVLPKSLQIVYFNSPKRNKRGKKKFSLHMVPKCQTTCFGCKEFQGLKMGKKEPSQVKDMLTRLDKARLFWKICNHLHTILDDQTYL